MPNDIWAITAVLQNGQAVADQIAGLQTQLGKTEHLGGMVMAGLGVVGVGAAVKWGRAMYDSAAAIMATENAVKRVFGPGAGSVIEEIGRLSESSVIADDSLYKVALRMGALGAASADARRQLKALVDTAGFLNLNQEEFEGLAESLAAIQEQGVAGMRVMSMWAKKYGVPVGDIIKKQLGVDIGTDLGAMKLEGIPRQRIVEALIKGLEEAYKGGAGMKMGSVPGTLRNTANMLTEINQESGKLVVEGLRPLAVTLNVATKGAKKFNEALGGVPGLAAMLGLLATGISFLGGAASKMGWLPSITKFLSGGLGGVLTALRGFIPALAAAGPWIAIAVGAFIELYAVFKIGARMWEQVTKAGNVQKVDDSWSRLITAHAPVFDSLSRAFNWLIDYGLAEITWAADELGHSLDRLAGFLGWLADQVKWLFPGAAMGGSGQNQHRAENALGGIKDNTKRIADAMESVKTALVGGGERARKRMGDLEVEYALSRALASGVG